MTDLAIEQRSLMMRTVMKVEQAMIDVMHPDKIAADQEAVRRFYLKNGYADFRIVKSDARYDQAQKGYYVTITVDEGAQYKVGSVNLESRLRDVSADALKPALKLASGEVYNGDLVEKTVDAITREVA